MADTIDHNGKEYIEIGWLVAANKTAKRRGDKIKRLQATVDTFCAKQLSHEAEIERLRACVIDMENDTSCLPEDMSVSDAVRLLHKEINRLREALVTIAECKDARAMYNVARAAVQDAPRDGV